VVTLASIKEHNQLIKVVFDGNKHLNHVLSSQEINKMTMLEERYPLTKLPVCGHCEKLGYWNRNGTAYCPSCGTYTKKPITYSSYLASGYDTDGTLAKWMVNIDKNKRSILPDYGE